VQHLEQGLGSFSQAEPQHRDEFKAGIEDAYLRLISHYATGAASDRQQKLLAFEVSSIHDRMTPFRSPSYGVDPDLLTNKRRILCSSIIP
jgi:hypothetical protein